MLFHKKIVNFAKRVISTHLFTKQIKQISYVLYN